MNKNDRVMEIFLDECKEILSEIAPKLLNLEETPNDKHIINDIFRGIHTLKGNANSFGFTKLGGFVHYFEDLLSIYRKEGMVLEKNEADLFIRAFDIVENVFAYEEAGRNEYPQNYDKILNEIKVALAIELNPQEIIPVVDILEDISPYIKYEHNEKINIEELSDMLKKSGFNYEDKAIENQKIYNIVMNLDHDIYLRGYNHQIFFRLLKELGEILFSYYVIDENVPYLDDFNTEVSFVKQISLYLLSDADEMDIQDVFEFIAEEHEISITTITLNDIQNIMQKKETRPKELIHETKVIVENKSSPAVIPTEELFVKSTDKVKSTIRVESIKLDELFDSIGELVIAQSYISQNEQIHALNNNELNQYLDMLGKSTRLIQSKVMGLRMVAIKDTFLKMKRVVRDVSIKTGKEIELILSGEDTEVDKTMVDKLSEPLIHLLRNSVDHGIEPSAEQRVSAGKESIGNIWLSASHRGSSFVIEIRDDGRGIDTKIILQKALEKGIAKAGVYYTDDEIIDFLFLAGFSTASTITDISGRGVGLDAVKQSIEELRGKITVETEFGIGSIFRIILPLTLAIIDGLTVKVGDEVLIVPILSVVESFSPILSNIHHVKGRGEFINFRGEILPIVRLNQLLNLSQEIIPFEKSTLICIDHDRGRYVLQVSELTGRQQVVIKSLGLLSNNIKEISGVAILGTGHIALILNIEGIRDYLDSGANT